MLLVVVKLFIDSDHVLTTFDITEVVRLVLIESEPNY